MNIGLFASNNVGYEIAAIFKDRNVQLSGLVLDSKDSGGYNERIINIAGCPLDNIVYSDMLYTEVVIEKLTKMQLDLIILAWWPYIIREKIISIPRLGCLNLHPSYLPFNRGKHYNFWTIVEDVPFGVTIHWTDKGVDTGDIAFQAVIEKSWEDTGETLYYEAQDEIVRLFVNNFTAIQTGNIPRIPQNFMQGSFHTAKELEPASRIDLNKSYSGRELLNLLRARTFPPHPAAWFEDKGNKYEVRVIIKKI